MSYTPEQRARHAENNRLWAQANPDKVKVIKERFAAAHPEKQKEYKAITRARHGERLRQEYREWRAANPEKAKLATERWRTNNHERVKAVTKAYRKRNASKIREQQRAGHRRYYIRHKDWHDARQKVWNQAHPEKLREYFQRYRALRNGNTIEPVDLEEVLLRDRGLCGICGQPVSPEDLEFDHIIPLSKGGSHSTDNLQVSHRFCNRSKGAKII